MGRLTIVDESVEKYLEKLIKENKWFVGVIIGQLPSQRNFVVHLARTPDPVEDEVSEENGEDESGDALSKSSKKNPALERPNSLEKLDEKWVFTHAKQVLRLLPGGLNVIGLFAVAPTVMLKNSQSKLKQMVHTVYRNLNKNATSSTESNSERLLLQLDTSIKKLSCTTIDASDIKSVPRPAEWKYQSGESKWLKLTSQISLDIPISVPSESKAQSLIKQLQVGLVTFCDSVKRSIIAIDGVIRDPSETLLQPSEKKVKGGKGSHSAMDSRLSQDVIIYLPFLCTEDSIDPKVTASQATINIMGTTIVRAFVSPKATVGDAIEALKMDIMRSLMVRCELLCEEFNVTEGKQGSEVYDPPVRLFCNIPQCGLQVCDYVFQDEKQEEVRDRIKELLDVEIEDLEETEKSAADDGTWSCPSTLSCMSSHQSLAAPQSAENKYLIKMYLEYPESAEKIAKNQVAAVVGFIAVLASWIFYQYLSNE